MGPFWVSFGGVLVPFPPPEPPLSPPRPSRTPNLHPKDGHQGGCSLIGGPQGGVDTGMAGESGPPPSSLRTFSGHPFVTSILDQYRHRFRGLFWEHSASVPDRPRCSRACKYHGQLAVDHFAPRRLRGHSQSPFRALLETLLVSFLMLGGYRNRSVES